MIAHDEQQAILGEIQETMRATFGNPAIAIDPHTTAEDIEGWDSLAQARLIVALENRLGVMFPGERLFDLASVGALIEAISSCRKDLE
jgi:acyl carrier protein